MPLFSSTQASRIAVLLACLLPGCAAVSYTVDDGRPVDEKLLANIRLFGQAEQTVRPAVLRSGALRDKDCDKQWELPIAVASSASWQAGAERVAWVRALQVDERVTVIASTPGVDLGVGDKLVDIDGYRKEDAERMIEALAGRRDAGKPFRVATSSGKSVLIVPVEVCRGHVLPAPPAAPVAQDYHWLMSVHPLEVFKDVLSPDEALWVVLWTQGLSEEAGARMKTYHYGRKTLTALLTLASFVSGFGAAAQAAQGAATSAAANAAATNAAGQFVARQAAQEVGKSIAEHLVQAAGQSALERELNAEAIAAANRAALGGVSWVAGGAFVKADHWAFERMERLGADPLAAFTLHEKLVRQVAARNAFVLDKERLPAMKSLVAALGRDTQLEGILNGAPLRAVPAAIAGVSLESMTLASEDVASDLLSMESFPPESRGGFLDSLAPP